MTIYRTSPVRPARQIARSKMLSLLGGMALTAGCIVCHAQDTHKPRQADSYDSVSSKTRAAQDVLNKLLQAYQSGEPLGAEVWLDPAMIDLQSLLDNIRDTQNQQKQIHITLTDVQVLAGADTVTIQANWEKRYLALPAMTPRLATGHMTVNLMRRTNGWLVNGISGDNLFAAAAR
jgi:hypothetical protein